MPTTLTKFINWLIDEKSFLSVNDSEQTNVEKLRKSLSITESIVSLSKNVMTPFHVGLALQLYHDFGSKQLIETLNAHGFCCSYDEVRRYLSSLANHEMNKIKNGVYIPEGLVTNETGGFIIQEGSDNIDINAETIDGKDTFHSMARAVFQSQSTNMNDKTSGCDRIRRGQVKSLPVDEQTMSLISCLPFKTSKQRHEPPRQDNAFPTVMSCSKNDDTTSESVWVLLRSFTRGIIHLPVEPPTQNNQTISFWTGFHSQLSQSRSKDRTLITYAPVVDSKPTDMATVYTTMQKCVDMSKELGQSHSIQTFDQQLYAISQQVKWSMPDVFSSHVVRLGGFHTLCCYLASVGKLWADGGLRDLLVDSGVYASGTVDQMLLGKQFNRAVRGLSLAYEALMSVFLGAFFKWCCDNGRIDNIPQEFWSQLKVCHNAFDDESKDKKSLFLALEDLYVSHLVPLLHEFRLWGQSESPTFQYWFMFLDAVEIMLQNIRAERAGLWSLHLQSVCNMLPYFFITNRTNYSRWTPVYILDMIDLPEDIKQEFNAGKFAIHQKAGVFNGIWSDMATEKTIIKDSKGNGGIVGLTRKKSALIRWTLTRHVLGYFSSEMRDRAGLAKDGDAAHDETKAASMNRDEQQVSDLIDHITTKMTNPFDVDVHPSSLINISSGLHASKEVQDSLLSSITDGTKMAESFIDGSLSNGNSVSFYNPIPKSKLKSFEDMTKKSKLKCRSGDTLNVHINPELIFRRALVLANS